jgi:hypothetical protein
MGSNRLLSLHQYLWNRLRLTLKCVILLTYLFCLRGISEETVTLATLSSTLLFSSLGQLISP